MALGGEKEILGCKLTEAHRNLVEIWKRPTTFNQLQKHSVFSVFHVNRRIYMLIVSFGVEKNTLENVNLRFNLAAIYTH